MLISRTESDSYVALSPPPKRNRDRIFEGFDFLPNATTQSPVLKKVKLELPVSGYLDLAILDKLGVTESAVRVQ